MSDIGVSNLCHEICIGEPMECTLEGPDLWQVFAELSINHKTQIKAELYKRGGGPEGKIINSFYSGAATESLIANETVVRFVDALLKQDTRSITEVTDTVSELILDHSYESLKLTASFAVNKSFEEKGLLPQLTKVVQTEVDKQIDHDQLVNDISAQLFGLNSKVTKESPMHIESAHTDPTKSELTEELVAKIGQAGESGVTKRKLTPAEFNGITRKPKRKKSKPKSNHIPNMKNGRTKAALGAVILSMLGKVQQDTQDTLKRNLLKELPMADFVELTSGTKLPDYQANLLNSMQAKADPNAPIVKSMDRFYKESLSDDAPRLESIDELVAVGNAVADIGRGLVAPELLVEQV